MSNNTVKINAHLDSRQRVMVAATSAKVPVLLWGLPGQAKTAIIESMFAQAGFHVETVIGSIREATDFLGLPITIDGEVHYAPPAWAKRLRDSELGLLFLDEITTSAPSTQKGQLRVIQERVVGEMALGDHVSIIAAANPPDVAVDGWDLAAPTANRFLHIDWKLDSDDWVDGLVNGFNNSVSHIDTDGFSENQKARWTGLVAGFIKTRNDMLTQLPDDPTAAGRAWASPRSWTNAVEVLGHLDHNDTSAHRLVLKGCVGEGPATEFLAWVQSADLPDTKSVLDNPSIVEWKKERPDRLFALMSSIQSYAMSNIEDKDVWESAIGVVTACAEGGKPDVATPAAKKLISNKPVGCQIPQETVAAFRDLLIAAGRIVEAA